MTQSLGGGDDIMEQSILDTLKDMLEVSNDAFDSELTVYINAAFSELHQLGAGPANGYMITGKEETWDDFTSIQSLASLCKLYIYLKLRLLWDVPSSTTVVNSLEKQLNEVEWRIVAFVENRASGGSEDGGASGTNDYNDLINLPKLNGKVIRGNITEADPTIEELTPSDIDNIFKTVFTGSGGGSVGS